ncbi:Protein of unknown function [Pyronema omphalodes CBS 100304]|uniref:Uncharacterized protein n=1 Tax=Pyronema omphalodes (strain CBS 100304) TaxID=1076935 RepID=U4LJS6_PYROM|nr:Protein of unknown function [Pyronema omphalodes CBS 100304]
MPWDAMILYTVRFRICFRNGMDDGCGWKPWACITGMPHNMLR